MNEVTKLTWLKRLLIFKILVVALLWGLPTWLAPEGILKIFGETLPSPRSTCACSVRHRSALCSFIGLHIWTQ